MIFLLELNDDIGILTKVATIGRLLRLLSDNLPDYDFHNLGLCLLCEPVIPVLAHSLETNFCCGQVIDTVKLSDPFFCFGLVLNLGQSEEFLLKTAFVIGWVLGA